MLLWLYTCSQQDAAWNSLLTAAGQSRGLAKRNQLIVFTCSFFSSRFISVIALSLSFTFCVQEQQILRPHCQYISTCPG